MFKGITQTCQIFKCEAHTWHIYNWSWGELEGLEKINEEMEIEQPGETPNKISDNNPGSNLNEHDINVNSINYLIIFSFLQLSYSVNNENSACKIYLMGF